MTYLDKIIYGEYNGVKWIWNKSECEMSLDGFKFNLNYKNKPYEFFIIKNKITLKEEIIGVYKNRVVENPLSILKLAFMPVC